MRRRILLTTVVLALVGVALVAVAQPPVAPPTTPPIPLPKIPANDPIPPMPPRTLPGLPASPMPAAAAVDPPLSRFQPIAAFPQLTQNAVDGVLLGADWMARMNQSHGRFLFGYNPALRQPLMGDHDLKQARGAQALALAAKFCGDEKQAALASQTILTLLASTRLDPADAKSRVPLQSSLICNRVGFAAVVALAIYGLPNADAKLIDQAEELCAFLRSKCKPDGSVHYTDGTNEVSTQIDPMGINEYPGVALHALMLGNRVRPAGWKTEAVKKGMEFYRAAFRANPHPMMAATLTPAYTELYLQTKLADAAAVVFEMSDWLCGMQIPGNDPRVPEWAGGFRGMVDARHSDVPPGPETGLIVQSLACAYQLNRLTQNLERNVKYKNALNDAVQFLTGMQYLEANTRHFENTFRVKMLIGGFHMSAADGNLRIDSTAHAVTGLLEFLGSGAEK